jgi:trk system potassium uptake protein TrkH
VDEPLRSVAFLLGHLLAVLAFSMIVPVVIDPADWRPFVLSAAITGFFAGSLYWASMGSAVNISAKSAHVLTAAAWLILPLFGALPLMFSGLSVTDAVFETVSGLTTTGSTILTDLDEQPYALLFWRALLQWIGGIGVIAMSIAILPFLRVGGMQLFRTESSDQTGKELPRAAAIAAATVWVYVILTFACAVAYWIAGMDTFDAVTHAMTTISTGGFSTHDASMGYFASAGIYWVSTIFMLAGGIPFVLYIRAARGRSIRSTQVETLLGVLLVVSLSLSVWLILESDSGPFEAVTLSVFNAVSVITTTGYAGSDYTTWGGFPVAVFFFLTFCGACTGSTSGGLKMMRLIVAVKSVMLRLRKMILPDGVFVTKYEGQALPQDVEVGVAVFCILFIVALALVFVGLSLTGLDLVTAMSGAATALANVGPGIGPVIGPASTFASLPDSAKWILCAGMLLGRLEIFTLLVLVTPMFWRA